MKKLIPLLFLILTGCASSQYVSRDAVEIVNDPYADKIEYLGITHGEKADGLKADSHNYFLRSLRDADTGEVRHQLYIENYYLASNWKFYERASYMGGEDAEFVKISSEVITCPGGCVYNEIFAVMIPDNRLRDESDGISLKVYAQSGNEMIIDISERQITAQIKALD